jgi:hypothetical protein
MIYASSWCRRRRRPPDIESNSRLMSVFAVKTWGLEVCLHSFLISVPGGCEWSASFPSRFILGKKLPSPTLLETVWVPEPIRMPWRRENLFPLLEIESLFLYLLGLYWLRSVHRPMCNRMLQYNILYWLTYPGAPVLRVAQTASLKQSPIATRAGELSCRLGEELTTPYSKELVC